MRIDLNCDLGEGCPHDADLMPLITSANIGCGAHAGSPTTCLEALRLAKQHGVQVGAHPGFLDRANFGRVDMAMSDALLTDLLLYQLEVLHLLAAQCEIRVRYLKPHGALYNMACRDEAVARSIVAVAERYDLALMALPGSRLEALAQGRCPFIAEGFADRRYLPDGSLVPRSRPDAFVHDPSAAVEQARQLIEQRGVQTLCVHGDNPRAVLFVRHLRQALTGAEFTITPFDCP